MPYEGEPTNPLGADEFIQLVTDEDIRFLKEDIRNIIDRWGAAWTPPETSRRSDTDWTPRSSPSPSMAATSPCSRRCPPSACT